MNKTAQVGRCEGRGRPGKSPEYQQLLSAQGRRGHSWRARRGQKTLSQTGLYSCTGRQPRLLEQEQVWIARQQRFLSEKVSEWQFSRVRPRTQPPLSILTAAPTRCHKDPGLPFFGLALNWKLHRTPSPGLLTPSHHQHQLRRRPRWVTAASGCGARGGHGAKLPSPCAISRQTPPYILPQHGCTHHLLNPVPVPPCRDTEEPPRRARAVPRLPPCFEEPPR